MEFSNQLQRVLNALGKKDSTICCPERFILMLRAYKFIGWMWIEKAIARMALDTSDKTAFQQKSATRDNKGQFT